MHHERNSEHSDRKEHAVNDSSCLSRLEPHGHRHKEWMCFELKCNEEPCQWDETLLLTMMRNDEPNGKAFDGTGSELNNDSFIGMHLHNVVKPLGASFQLVWLVNKLENLVIDLTIMGEFLAIIDQSRLDNVFARQAHWLQWVCPMPCCDQGPKHQVRHTKCLVR